jgi:hypothetical protein
LTIKEIAERMKLGTSQAANSNLHLWMKNNGNALENRVRGVKDKRAECARK